MDTTFTVRVDHSSCRSQDGPCEEIDRYRITSRQNMQYFTFI